MNRFTMFLPAYFSVLVASTANAAPTAACPITTTGAHVAALPDDWRAAVEGLIQSTASPDLPWGCVGGEVDLIVNGSSGTITVVDASGHAISREVESPDEVIPLGQALLAKPLIEQEPAPIQQPAHEVKPKIAPIPDRDPRALLAATVGPRYEGPSNIAWGSFGISAAVPFRPWSGGVWVRYDGFSSALDKPVPPISQLSLGALASWSLSLGRFAFRPMLKPSLAVVTRRVLDNDFHQMGGPAPMPPKWRDDTQVDFRIGAEAQFVVALARRLRAIVGFDAEVSPKQLAFRTDFNHFVPGQTHMPLYTLGLGLGLEVAVP